MNPATSLYAKTRINSIVTPVFCFLHDFSREPFFSIVSTSTKNQTRKSMSEVAKTYRPCGFLVAMDAEVMSLSLFVVPLEPPVQIIQFAGVISFLY